VDLPLWQSAPETWVLVANIGDKFILGLNIMGAYDTTVDLEVPHAITGTIRGIIMMSYSLTTIISQVGHYRGATKRVVDSMAGRSTGSNEQHSENMFEDFTKRTVHSLDVLSCSIGGNHQDQEVTENTILGC
jgi:hypothetical protein